MEALGLKIAGDLALQGAGWAVAMLLGYVVVHLYREGRKDGATFIAALTDVKAIVQANTTASAAHALALEGIKATLETRGYAIGDLSKQIENLSKDVEQQFDRTRERMGRPS